MVNKRLVATGPSLTAVTPRDFLASARAFAAQPPLARPFRPPADHLPQHGRDERVTGRAITFAPKRGARIAVEAA